MIKEKEDPFELIESNLSEIKNRLSRMRKEGINVKIPSIKIMNLPNKLEYAKISEEEVDRDNILSTITEIIEEMDSIQIEFNDQKTKEIIEKIKKNIDQKDGAQAKENYKILMDEYKELTKEGKAKIVKDCVELGKKIKEM